MTPPAAPLDRAGVEAIIPHRAPFLLVDGITALEPGVSAEGWIDVTDEMPWLAGHFPGRPIMPGVLQVEALAQVGAVCGLSHPDYAGRLALFAAIHEARFSRIVVPGDRLDLAVRITRLRSRIGKAEGKASVGGEAACRAELTFALAEEAG
jgi:3-hydroxyacyl-[acyl-carrier-protein] dehydratase